MAKSCSVISVQYLLKAALVYAFAAAVPTVRAQSGIDLNLGIGLKLDFYKDFNCGQAESVVFNVVKSAFDKNKEVAAGLIRMHFHDCFVRGCDGSVLIDSTPGNVAEKDSPVNNPSLHGFDIIAAAKAQLEAECPATVSCADILAFAARDSAKLASPLGLANWDVKGGRRDGKISLVADVNGNNIPSPAGNVSELTQVFVSKGLSQKDMVFLSGAHTIGVSHCNVFVLQRLYNFSSTHPTDPSLDPNYAAQLKLKCPSNTNNNNITFPMETLTPEILDNYYYKNVQNRRGLFISDATLLTDPNTASTVQQCASSNLLVFSPQFSAAMARLANVGILTGQEGEIRLNCSKINS